MGLPAGRGRVKGSIAGGGSIGGAGDCDCDCKSGADEACSFFGEGTS